MNIKELHTKLKRMGVSEESYYLHGLFGSSDDNEKIALTIRKENGETVFEVYFKERGDKHSIRTFAQESEACEYLLHEIQEEMTISKVKKVAGLVGMSVNERLFKTGLMDEFDSAKKKNKTRASQILRILGVDASSIKKILR